MNDTQPEALRLADQMDVEQVRTVQLDVMHFDAARLLRTQHAAIERKDALLRKLIAALDSDRHDIDDWPPESCEAVYDIRQELSQ